MARRKKEGGAGARETELPPCSGLRDRVRRYLHCAEHCLQVPLYCIFYVFKRPNG